MEINEKAPGNISQSPVTRSTDNETGFTQELGGDLGHRKGGDTQPLPSTNEPLVLGAGDVNSQPKPDVLDGDQLTDVDRMNSRHSSGTRADEEE